MTAEVVETRIYHFTCPDCGRSSDPTDRKHLAESLAAEHDFHFHPKTEPEDG